MSGHWACAIVAPGGWKILDDARRLLFQRIRSEIRDSRVVAAMERVPREEFVPGESRHLAYEDHPLPIGEDQTISQPFIVALMLEALELRRSDRVLEVGTGSGYQAALLGELAREVVTVERIDSLASTARERLGSLGYRNVTVKTAGDRLGWPDGAVRRDRGRGGVTNAAAFAEGAARHGWAHDRTRRAAQQPGADEGHADRRLILRAYDGRLPVRPSHRAVRLRDYPKYRVHC